MEQLLLHHPLYSYVYAGRQSELRAKYGIDLQPEQFRKVADQISSNPTMLRKDEHALFARYERGDLCALVARHRDTGELSQQVLGTVTMDLLVDIERIGKYFSDELQILARRFPSYVQSFPSLFELGAVDLDPSVRGYKLAHLIHDAVLAPHAENIRRRRTVVVLTTQRPEEVLTVDTSEHVPTSHDPLVKHLQFRIYARGNVPGVDVFTCTCGSQKKRGYGVSFECPSAVPMIEEQLRPRMIRLIDDKKTEIACHIGISSGDYAGVFSQQVMALGKVIDGRATPQQQLQHIVYKLRDGGYYNE